MRVLVSIIIMFMFVTGCKEQTVQRVVSKESKIRPAKGYAQHDWQMDSIYKRLQLKDTINDLQWKAAISPHDNYSFTGQLYYESLRGINAPNIILIGVAHRARNFNLQDKIVFGRYDEWESPYGGIKVGSLGDAIMTRLPENDFVVHDSMQLIEHSLEAIIPWLHKKNRTAEITPILVPYLNYDGIDAISGNLANVVHEIMKAKKWTFGKDVAVVISNDAVHYGDQEWGNNATMAPFGIDSAGTEKARQLDLEIIANCLTEDITPEKIKLFTEYTVKKEDYKEYKWVWCGRYSVPFGVSFANKLNLLENKEMLTGTFLGYQTSIDHPHIEVEDLGMEINALTTNRHWVAYTSIVYE